jgi:uncharacterized protein (UPF0218 family)
MAQRLTPLEAAIADTKDRRRAYEKRRRDAGDVKITVWVPSEAGPLVKAICAALSAAEGRKRAMIMAYLKAFDAIKGAKL